MSCLLAGHAFLFAPQYERQALTSNMFSAHSLCIACVSKIGGALPCCGEGVLLAKWVFLGNFREGEEGGKARPLPPPHQDLAPSSG